MNGFLRCILPCRLPIYPERKKIGMGKKKIQKSERFLPVVIIASPSDLKKMRKTHESYKRNGSKNIIHLIFFTILPQSSTIVTELANVSNHTSNTVDKSRYCISQGLMWSKLIG